MDSQTSQKLDKIADRINSIDLTLVAQHITLKEHVRRSNLLEKQISIVQKEIKPIERHVWLINGGLKVVGSLSLVVSFLKLIHFL